MGERENLWPGWETVRLIGRGSFGAVYEIERDVFGHKEKAALKAITIPQSSSDIEELYDSGYDEASVTATFKSHLESIVNEYSLMREMNGAANVVNCDDFRIVPHDDNIGWDIYIKMELLTPLTKALDRQPGEEQVVQIAKNMCNALILCRKYGIIHRDIKPQNIFVSKNGDYKLGDFGIAKTIEKTTGGTKIGTYKYMAPEVYNNRPYNLTADIYSLGLVLHWMLNERRSPFMPLPPAPAVASQEDEARVKRFGGEPVPAPAHGSTELKRIVLKACAYDPKNRYQTADEMLHDLNALSVAEKPQDAPSVTPPAEEAEDDKTVGAWTSPAAQPQTEKDKTVGAWAVPEEPAAEATAQPEEDKTVGVWTQTPETKKPEPAPAPAPAPKKQKKWWLAAVAALVVVAVAIAGTRGGKTAQTAPKPTSAPTATTNDQTLLGVDMTPEEFDTEFALLAEAAKSWTIETAPQTLDEFPLLPQSIFSLFKEAEAAQSEMEITKSALTWTTDLPELLAQSGYATTIRITPSIIYDTEEMFFDRVEDHTFIAQILENMDFRQTSYAYFPAQVFLGDRFVQLMTRYEITNNRMDEAPDLISLWIYKEAEYSIHWSTYRNDFEIGVSTFSSDASDGFSYGLWYNAESGRLTDFSG